VLHLLWIKLFEILLKFQQLGVRHVRTDLKLRLSVWSIICLPQIHILNSEGTHDALQQHAAIHSNLTQWSQFNRQWRAQRQMKDKVTERSEERAKTEETMQGRDLWENENEGQAQRGRCGSYVEEKMGWEVKTITQHDSQKHGRRSGGHAVTVCAVTTLGHRKRAEVRLGAQRWRLRYAAVRMELIRERKRTERLLQHQKEQDTNGVFAGALEGSWRWRGWQQKGAGRGAGERGRRGDAGRFGVHLLC